MAGAEDGASLAQFLARKTTLYLSGRSGKVEVASRQIVLNQETRLPFSEIRRVVLIGAVKVRAELLYRCLRQGLAIDWLDATGQPLGQCLPEDAHSDAFLKSQMAFGASPGALELARVFILAKMDNCHEALRRRAPSFQKDRELRGKIATAASAASLRGLEGAAAREYFSFWRELLPEWDWRGRYPHPAPDGVNFILSLGYGMLRNRLASALRHVGLNPRLGFFHETRGRHAALASDLLEPLRPLVDNCCLTMLRRHELTREAFRVRLGRCTCADHRTFAFLLEKFEEMFASCHKFYPDCQNPRRKIARTLNDMLDDLAESYAMHIHDYTGCIVPRLAPCVPA